MKLSLSWIKEYVDLPSTLDTKQLSYDLTMRTVEVEGAENLGDKFENIIVGEIKAVNPHPNADKLRVCTVDIGSETKEIVCGGSNLYVGMKCCVAKPGAWVRWHGEGEPVEIKNAKLRGVESYGMICASSEVLLGDLFPAHEEAEVMDLSAFVAPAGTNLADALDLNDIILEIDNKSMTNRPDLWGHYGIARELAAIYGLPLKKIETFKPTCGENDFTVEITDTKGCPRYVGVRIDGVSVKASPYKMQNRIWKVGMRPINALVDITNYVMLATGQPTHAFDCDNIKGHINVRRAAEGEELLLLNGKDLKLKADDLVISDAEGAVALAGVMGGAKDSILPKTEKVILEVANFESRGIRKTALRYDNRTEASSRYEKAVDTQRVDQALALSMQLFAELYPEMKVTGYCDRSYSETKRNELDVSLDWLERRLGKRISNEDIARQMASLGFDTKFDGDNMHVVVPTWRSTGDVSIKADIMEEVARLYGYENFEPTSITTTFTGAINQLDKDLVRRIKEYLSVRCGMQEVFTYPWMETPTAEAVLGSFDGVLELSTPPSPEENYIRSSLLPNICDAVVKNERYFTEFGIYEEAQVFADRNYVSKYDASELLPEQVRKFAGAFAGASDDITKLFRRAKGVIENMSRFTHMEGFTFAKNEKPFWADDTVWVNVYVDEEKIGDLALLSRKTAMAVGVRNLAVMLFELSADAMKPFTSRTNGFEHLVEYPVAEYDVSLLFDSAAKWSDIYTAAVGKKGPQNLVKDAAFVDEYRGKQVPEGKKSVTIKLFIGADDRTLKSEEIEKTAESVIKKLSKLLGAEMRKQ